MLGCCVGRYVTMEISGTRQTESPWKTLWDGVKEDMSVCRHYRHFLSISIFAIYNTSKNEILTSKVSSYLQVKWWCMLVVSSLINAWTLDQTFGSRHSEYLPTIRLNFFLLLLLRNPMNYIRCRHLASKDSGRWHKRKDSVEEPYRELLHCISWNRILTAGTFLSSCKPSICSTLLSATIGCCDILHRES